MKTRRIGVKLIIVTLISIAFVTTVAIGIMYFGNRAIVDGVLIEDATVAMNAVNAKVDLMKDSSLSVATTFANDSSIINATQQGDKAEALRVLYNSLVLYNSTTEFVVLTDSDGKIIARTDSEGAGYSILNQSAISQALEGVTASYVDTGVEIKLSIRSSAPVKDSNGKVIGSVLTGYKLDNEKFVDELKALTGAEISVFLGDELINTTVVINGVRETGIKLSTDIGDKVINQKQTYIEELDIIGEPYITYYSPIINTKDEVVGIFFAGKPIKDLQNSIQNITAAAVVIILILTSVISFLLVLFFRKNISIPINNLKELLSEVATGNLDVVAKSNSYDEIGELTRTTGKVIDTILELLNSMDKMSDEFESGNIDARIDCECFSGSYKKVVENINKMQGNSTLEMLVLLECVKEIGNGDFNSDIPKQIGKKVIMNETIDNLREHLKSVSSSIQDLVSSATDGKLSARANTNNFKGDWYDITLGLNNLMDAIVLPINETISVLEEVSKGNFDLHVTGYYKGDFAKMKRSINTTVAHIDSYIEEISLVLYNMSKDDFNQEITNNYIGKFSNIKKSVNMIILKFNSILIDINSAATLVSSGARQIADNSMSLAMGSSEQAASIEELTGTIVSINNDTLLNVKNANAAEVLSHDLKDGANDGNKSMDKMLLAMDAINQSSIKISNIIKVIDDIAFQTNILALNAAVEAARAGKYGRGFVVVANEVRTLASKSQEAAKETEELIEESTKRVTDGTIIADETSYALKNILGNVAKVSEIVTNITTSSGEQANAIGMLSLGVKEISKIVQNNSSASQESASSSEELSSQAEVLKSIVSKYKTKK